MSVSSSSEKNYLQKSILTETKEKFDTILKDALQVSSYSSPKGYPKTEKSGDVPDLMNEEENREFILNKFFETSDSVHIIEEDKPIPKPRTKLKRKNDKNITLSPNSSNETFEVTSPKVFPVDGNQHLSNRSSASSTNTYKVSSPKVLNTKNDESSSQRTFRVVKEDAPKVGDIIIHEKDSISKIVEVQVKNEISPQQPKKKSGNLSCSPASAHDSKIEKSDWEKNDGRVKVEQTHDITQLDGNKKECNILHVTIHKSDKLLLDSFVIHPVVKIHVVDINSGNYFQKNKDKSGATMKEDNLEYIPPVITRPYNLQEKRSLIPSWEETISVKEEYQYFVEEKDNLIFFFQILDFVSMHLIDNKTTGWHKIAFAFLKAAGKGEMVNFNKNMRLQLYYSSYKKEDVRKCSAWEIWNKGKLMKYPSSLYVSIMSSEIKNKLMNSANYLISLKEGTHETSDHNVKKEERNNNILSSLNTSNHKLDWKRNSGEITKLPNNLIAQFETEEDGCFTLRFSHSGSFLACSLKQKTVFSIAVFSLDTFEQVCNLPGHQGLIYSIRWSFDDSLIIACSADCSVSIWNVKQISFLQILPHPKFVYANEIGNDVIATGCYDKKLRIWNKDSFSLKYLLNQELEGHTGYITSLLFKKNLDSILSSDSVGVIIEWCKKRSMWIFQRKIKIMGLEGIVINQIELVAKEKRLLVHSRDSTLRIMDMESSVVIHWLQGGLNTRFQTSCSVSPCGNYIIAGSENATVNIWSSKNGKCISNLVPYKNKNVTIHALQFHPKHNLIAVGTYGEYLPVLIFGYSRNEEKNMKHGKSEKPLQNDNLRVDVLKKFDKLMIKKFD